MQKEFSLRHLLTMTTGAELVNDGGTGLFEIANHVARGQLKGFSSLIQKIDSNGTEIADLIERFVRNEHPDLPIAIPKRAKRNEATLDAWIAEQEAKYGKTRMVGQMPDIFDVKDAWTIIAEEQKRRVPLIQSSLSAPVRSIVSAVKTAMSPGSRRKKSELH